MKEIEFSLKSMTQKSKKNGKNTVLMNEKLLQNDQITFEVINKEMQKFLSDYKAKVLLMKDFGR